VSVFYHDLSLSPPSWHEYFQSYHQLGYEFYQPVVAARQFSLGQVPPHFLLHRLTINRVNLPDASPPKDATAYFQTFSSQALLTSYSLLRPLTSRSGGQCGRPMSSRKPWGRCSSKFMPSMKSLKKRYHRQPIALPPDFAEFLL
jgi:hypothetical protein